MLCYVCFLVKRINFGSYTYDFSELLGCVFGGTAYDRSNKLGLFIFVTFGLGGVVAVIPWCANFVLMLIAFILLGLAGGVIKTGEIVTNSCVNGTAPSHETLVYFIKYP